MRENDWTKVLGWPGYKVYLAEIDERGQAAEAVGAAQTRKQATGLLGMRSFGRHDCRDVRTGSARSALVGVPYDCGGGTVPAAMPGLWRKGGEGTPSTQQSTLQDRKSTRLNSSHLGISYAVFC